MDTYKSDMSGRIERVDFSAKLEKLEARHRQDHEEVRKSAIDNARQQWGKVFNAFRLACGYANAAWYQSENKQAWIDEEIGRLRSIIQQTEKEIDHWKARKA